MKLRQLLNEGKYMKLRQLLNEGKYDSVKLLMKKYFKECSKKYFPDLYGKYPDPTFEIKSHHWAGWFKATGNIMGISSDLAAQTDEYNVKSTVYHETIHYYQFHTYTPSQWSRAANGGHDDFFKEKMSAINSVEGSGFVNIKHEQSKISKSATEINVYGFVDNHDNYCFMWTATPNEKMNNWINTSAKSRYKNIFIFSTDDFYFKTNQNRYKGGSSLKFGIIEDPSKIEFVKGKLK